MTKLIIKDGVIMNIKYHLNIGKLGERDVIAPALEPVIISKMRKVVHCENPYNAIVIQKNIPQQFANKIMLIKKRFLNNAMRRG